MIEDESPVLEDRFPDATWLIGFLDRCKSRFEHVQSESGERFSTPMWDELAHMLREDPGARQCRWMAEEVIADWLGRSINIEVFPCLGMSCIETLDELSARFPRTSMLSLRSVLAATRSPKLEPLATALLERFALDADTAQSMASEFLAMTQSEIEPMKAEANEWLRRLGTFGVKAVSFVVSPRLAQLTAELEKLERLLALAKDCESAQENRDPEQEGAAREDMEPLEETLEDRTARRDVLGRQMLEMAGATVG